MSELVRTKRELMAHLRALGDLTKKERNAIVCALVGHSRIVRTRYKFVACARCGAELGDRRAILRDAWDDSADCRCDICRKNYAAMGWRDKLYVPDPFKKKEEE